jgi:hypothetical protein
MDKQSRTESESNSTEAKALKFLGRPQIEMIDEALSALGPYGEVHLILEKGRLRFVVTKTSHDALKWEPGSLESDGGTT